MNSVDEHKYLENYEYYRHIYDQSPLCYFAITLDGTIKKVNHSAATALHLLDKDIEGQLLQNWIAPKDHHIFFSCLEKCLEGEKASAQVTLTRQCGFAYAQLHAVKCTESQTTQIIHLVMSDITPFKQAEEKAKNSDQVKSQFLANMSHEIRTPLGAIIGFAELLLESEIPFSEQKKFLQIIVKNGRNLSRLVDDILDLSKVEAGRLEIEKTKIPLREFMSEVASLFTERASKKNIILNFNAEGELPAEIISDATRLRQILVNIIGNAIKFTERGQVTITYYVRQESESRPAQLRFLIKDTGTGIAPENVHKLFRYFSQAESETGRLYGGTGLGLFLSRKLARALGGNVVLLESDVNHGSTFVVTVSTNLFEHELISSSTAPCPSQNEFQGKQDLREVRILLVEDSVENQIYISRLLQSKGATVDIAANGRVGISKAQTGNYDIILMDVQMPVLDGLSATAELRSQGYNKPIIALTAHAMKEDYEKSAKAGCNHHLTKPISSELLLQLITKEVSRVHH